MPPFPLYEVTIPVFIRNLRTLQKLLAKGQAHPVVSGLALNDLRLAPDMRPFTFQVQTACNSAKFQAVRVGGVENLFMEDTEKTFPELTDRVARTIEFLEAVKPDCMEGREDVQIKPIVRNGVRLNLTGKQYTFEFSIPNFFFHLSMVYAILRKEGVDIGKQDYLGNTP